MVIPATVAACLASGAIRRLPSLRPWAGLGLVALTALPWAIPYALTPEHASSQTIGASHAVAWYFDRYRTSSSIPLAGSLGEFLPWALWLIPVAVWWRLSSDRQAYRPVLAWMLVFVVLVGLSAQQRSRYLLPVYPMLALFVAAAVTAGASRARALMRLNAIILIVMLAGALATAGWLLLANPRISGTPIAVFVSTAAGAHALLAGLGIAGPAIALRELRTRRSPSRALCCVAGALALVLLFVASTYSGRLETTYPIRSFAARVRPSLDRNAPLLAYHDANLAFDFYLDHPIAEVFARQTIAGRLQSPAAGAVLLRDIHWEDLRRTTHPSWCPVDRVSLGSARSCSSGRVDESRDTAGAGRRARDHGHPPCLQRSAEPRLAVVGARWHLSHTGDAPRSSLSTMRARTAAPSGSAISPAGMQESTTSASLVMRA